MRYENNKLILLTYSKQSIIVVRVATKYSGEIKNVDTLNMDVLRYEKSLLSGENEL